MSPANVLEFLRRIITHVCAGSSLNQFLSLDSNQRLISDMNLVCCIPRAQRHFVSIVEGPFMHAKHSPRSGISSAPVRGLFLLRFLRFFRFFSVPYEPLVPRNGAGDNRNYCAAPRRCFPVVDVRSCSVCPVSVMCI